MNIYKGFRECNHNSGHVLHRICIPEMCVQQCRIHSIWNLTDNWLWSNSCFDRYFSCTARLTMRFRSCVMSLQWLVGHFPILIMYFQGVISRGISLSCYATNFINLLIYFFMEIFINVAVTNPLLYCMLNIIFCYFNKGNRMCIHQRKRKLQ